LPWASARSALYCLVRAFIRHKHNHDRPDCNHVCYCQHNSRYPCRQSCRVYGRRPILIAGPFILAIGSLGCGLAANYWQLLVARFIQGAGSALFSTAALIMLTDISKMENRGQYNSLLWAANGLDLESAPYWADLLLNSSGCMLFFFLYTVFCLLASLWHIYAYLKPNLQHTKFRESL